MSSTSQLTGFIGWLLLVSIPCAFLASWAMLAAYHRAVTKRMHTSAPDTTHVSGMRGVATVPRRSTPLDVPRILRTLERTRWHTAGIYALAGLVAAGLMTWTGFIAGHTTFLPLRTTLTTFVYAWPAVMTTVLVAALSTRERLQILLAYFGILAVCSLGLPLLSPTSGRTDLVVLWATSQLAPTLLVLATLHDRVRAIAPLLLMFLVVCLTGSNLALAWLAGHIELAARVASRIGVGAVTAFWLIAAIGFVSLAAPSAGLLVALRAAYRRKLLSEQTIAMDTLWLLFCVSHATYVTFDGGPLWFALALVIPFVGYRVVAATALRSVARRRLARSGPAPKLLLLRVFSLGRKSVQLWELLARTFSYAGSVRMIAGPDLATTSIEPHEFLDFVTGKLDLRFIAGSRALERAMREVDDAPDADGRYRVNDFFCRDDVWREAFERLLSDSDVVVMDVRGFQDPRGGCAYELGQLAIRADLTRAVLLIDETTHRENLVQALSSAAPDSTRRVSPQLVPFHGNDARSAQAVIAALRQALNAASTVSPASDMPSSVEVAPTHTAVGG